MKKRKAKSSINLEKLAGGAFTEKLNEALAQVAENIQNPNTDASTKRGITVNIKFQPSKNREMVSTTIQVTTKLAATEAIETQMIMGTTRAGEIQIAEYGQMTMDEMEQEAAAQAEAQAPEAEQTEIQQPQQPGKPLDLRNRGKQPEAEAPVLVAGRDYDPNTGEVYENPGQTTGQVLPFTKKAAQA